METFCTFSIIFSFHTHFPVDSIFVGYTWVQDQNTMRRLSIQHHAGFMWGSEAGDNKKWEWINPPPTSNITNIPVRQESNVYENWESRTNVYSLALLSQFNLIWIYCLMFSLYLLLFAIQQEIECHCQVWSPSSEAISLIFCRDFEAFSDSGQGSATICFALRHW